MKNIQSNNYFGNSPITNQSQMKTNYCRRQAMNFSSYHVPGAIMR